MNKTIIINMAFFVFGGLIGFIIGTFHYIGILIKEMKKNIDDMLIKLGR